VKIALIGDLITEDLKLRIITVQERKCTCSFSETAQIAMDWGCYWKLFLFKDLH